MQPTDKMLDNLSKQGVVVQISTNAGAAAPIVASKTGSVEHEQYTENKEKKELQNDLISTCIKNLTTRMNAHMILHNLLRYDTTHPSSEAMKNIIVGMCHVGFFKNVIPILITFQETETILLNRMDLLKLLLALGDHPVIGSNLKENQDFKQLTFCLKCLLEKDVKPSARAETIKAWMTVKLDFNVRLLAFLEKKINKKKIELYSHHKVLEKYAKLRERALAEYPEACAGAIKNIKELIALEKETIDILDVFISGKPVSHEKMDCLMNLNEGYSDAVIEIVMARFCKDLKDQKFAQDQKKLVEMIVSSKPVDNKPCIVRVFDALQNDETRSAFIQLAKAKGIKIEDWMLKLPSSEQEAILLGKSSKMQEGASSSTQVGAGAGSAASLTGSSSAAADSSVTMPSESKKSGCIS